MTNLLRFRYNTVTVWGQNGIKRQIAAGYKFLTDLPLKSKSKDEKSQISK
jgi:hypothetical protein